MVYVEWELQKSASRHISNVLTPTVYFPVVTHYETQISGSVPQCVPHILGPNNIPVLGIHSMEERQRDPERTHSVKEKEGERRKVRGSEPHPMYWQAALGRAAAATTAMLVAHANALICLTFLTVPFSLGRQLVPNVLLSVF